MTRFGLKLTDFNGWRLLYGPVHGWTLGSSVFSCERELGSCGPAEEGEGEGREQHVKEPVNVELDISALIEPKG